MVTPRTGVKDEANAVVDLPLPGLLAAVCGVTVDEYCPLPLGQEQPLAFAPDAGIAGSGQAALWCDVLDPGQAEVVARYTADYFAGAPAVTLHRRGAGHAVYVGTFGDASLFAALAPWWLQLAGVAPGFATPPGVEAVARVGAQGAVWALLNHTAAPVRVTLPQPMVNVWAAAAGAVHEVELAPYDVVFMRGDGDA